MHEIYALIVFVIINFCILVQTRMMLSMLIVLIFEWKKDAIDLLQGHYIVSVSRDLTAPSQQVGLNAIAVSIIYFTITIQFHQPYFG